MWNITFSHNIWEIWNDNKTYIHGFFTLNEVEQYVIDQVKEGNITVRLAAHCLNCTMDDVMEKAFGEIVL